MNLIDISCSCGIKPCMTKKDIRAFMNSVIGRLSDKSVELSVSFVSEDEMHQMNMTYRNIDDSTDILSFASCDDCDCPDFAVPSRCRKNIGDIVICPDVLKRNSERFNVTENEELRRLLIHGLLHLSGYDHSTNDFCSEPMLIKQEEILKELSGDYAQDI